MSERAAGLARIRRGLGFIFLLAGLIHGGEMVLATLYASGRVPFVITTALWSQLYFADYLFLTVGSLAYLALSFASSGLFYYETLVDFFFGFGGFLFVWTLTALLLYHRLIWRWFSLAPSAAMAGYGLFLRSGRTLFPNRSDASANP